MSWKHHMKTYDHHLNERIKEHLENVRKEEPDVQESQDVSPALAEIFNEGKKDE